MFWLSWSIKDLWDTKVMYGYVPKLLCLIPCSISQIKLRRPSLKTSLNYVAEETNSRRKLKITEQNRAN